MNKIGDSDRVQIWGLDGGPAPKRFQWMPDRATIRGFEEGEGARNGVKFNCMRNVEV